MRLGRSIIHAFYNLVVVFLFFQKNKNELILSPYTCESAINPKILLNFLKLYTYLTLR
jgi:hypothetical protein